ncbi:MAG: uL13 family ribosomal protein, partial [Clostridia bacterium]|nr:uL13 family ribosomal protein [Clostridia bacterium]
MFKQNYNHKWRVLSVNKTYMAKPEDIKEQWHVVDATDLILGRLASIVA